MERTFKVNDPAALMTPKEHRLVKKPRQPAKAKRCG